MLSGEDKYSYSKFKNDGKNTGQHVIVTIAFSQFRGLEDIYHQWEDNLHGM